MSNPKSCVEVILKDRLLSPPTKGFKLRFNDYIFIRYLINKNY
jgi:hypothetical protein